ncbi:MAG: ABC transporter permease subunit [SAR324 cluster bacterium]|nr:ABC transporter permease subunit [SAR324 cluster bacterium]MBF0351436.1 ABC transporter permease subunit [SAR324 cluster bacterium]
MNGWLPIFKRELFSYFRSPVAYVFIVIFLMASAGCTFLLGNFYKMNQATLEIFFLFHPWLYLFLIPAVGMRLWAEERRTGTVELLLTMPVNLFTVVFSKFLAAWAFITIALVLTFPMILTVQFLGEPDNGPIIAGYLGSALMAGAYLAISSCTSALTKNQVISFILSVIICLVLVLLGWGVMADVLNAVFPVWISDLISQFSFTTHFNAIRRGVVDLRDIVYFGSIIGFMLMMNVVILDSYKSL